MSTFLTYTWSAFKDISGFVAFLTFWVVAGGSTMFLPVVIGGLVGGFLGMCTTGVLWIIFGSVFVGFYQWLRDKVDPEAKITEERL